jgi:hypothetical protein
MVHMPIIPVLGRQRQEDHEFKASLGLQWIPRQPKLQIQLCLKRKEWKKERKKKKGRENKKEKEISIATRTITQKPELISTFKKNLFLVLGIKPRTLYMLPECLGFLLKIPPWKGFIWLTSFLSSFLLSLPPFLPSVVLGIKQKMVFSFSFSLSFLFFLTHIFTIHLRLTSNLLCSLVWPWTHDPPASVSPVPGLQIIIILCCLGNNEKTKVQSYYIPSLL